MLKVYVSVHILSRILCAFGPEANAVWGLSVCTVGSFISGP